MIRREITSKVVWVYEEFGGARRDMVSLAKDVASRVSRNV